MTMSSVAGSSHPWRPSTPESGARTNDSCCEHDAMDSFLQACRTTGPLQLHLDWPGSAGGERLDFETPYVVVGHAPRSDLVLEHGEVCDRHAYLQLIGGRLYCVDMGSRGGTLREGERLGEGWV